MEQTTSKTAAIYCRVSSREQVEGTSLDMQESLCREFAERNGLRILGVFLDKGESAKTADREQFTQAIQLCAKRAPRIDRFIVYKLDRFARNQADHVTIRALLKRYGTELVSVSEPINETPIGKALEGMLSVFAEFDNNVRTERCSAGMLARLQQGIWVWGAPVGYYRMRKGANLTPDPKTATFILTAFTEYATGTHTYESLAKLLNERGFVTRTGQRPCKQLMEKILKNHIYYGEMKAWGKSYKGAFESIISEELFWRCQTTKRRKSAHAERRVAENPNFPLRKFVVCTQCLKPLTGSTSVGSKGRRYSYYHHHRQLCEQATFVPAGILDSMFTQTLEKVTPRQSFFKLFEELMKQHWSKISQVKEETAKKIRGDIALLQEQRNQFFELHRAGKYNDEEFLDQKNRFSERIRLGYELLEQQTHREEFKLNDALEAFKWACENMARTWQILPHPFRTRFQLLVYPEKLLFDGRDLGNSPLSLIFQQKVDLGKKKSNWVDPDRQLWNQIQIELGQWLELKRDFDRFSKAQYNTSEPGDKKPTSGDVGMAGTTSHAN